MVQIEEKGLLMSADYVKLWGKATKNDDGSLEWHPLAYHCLDVAAVAEVMFQENTKLSAKMSSLLGLDETLFHRLFVFFLALHDLGKFSDAFQGQIPELFSTLQPGSPIKTYTIRHDSLGFMLWNKEFLKREGRGRIGGKLVEYNYFGLNSDQARNIKEILNWFIGITTGHHGKPPSNTGYTGNTIDLNSHFSPKNIHYSYEFLASIHHLFFSKEHISLLSKINFDIVKENIKIYSFWLAGLSVLCDWIGSNKEYFPYETREMDLKIYWKDCAIPNAKKAILKAGILPSPISSKSSPEQLFSNPTESITFIPTPLQKACDTIALSKGAQLIILEDVTGAGKTEASFILAKRLMEIANYDGLFIGLPTMATANGMYTRTGKIYKHFFQPNTNPSIVLAHGARGLSKEFTDTIISDKIPEDISYGKGEESASITCREWLADSSKKSTLSDFGVGTIDQVLISILLSKFQSLRLFGMMNKVLILDEVHAYDNYMNELIEKLLTAQARVGGSVILLSATLPNELKNKFMSAYQSCSLEFQDQQLVPYPLITQTILNKPPNFIPVETRNEVKRSVKVEFLYEKEEIYSLIEKSINDNKCVCWIRNTVSDAMSAYEALFVNPSVQKKNVILFHARFAMGDRLDKEEEVLRLFGKNSNSSDRSGKIVIATQVVEQSLDLDFDVMITDLAPIDLVIQRAGRLHRHTRNIQGNRIQTQDERGNPILHVYSPKFDDYPAKNWYISVFRGGSKVYPDHGKLYLTAKILQSKREIKMPEEARNLIEFVYGNRETIPELLLEVSRENETLGKQKSAQAQNNTINLETGYTAVDNEAIWNDITAPTRLGEKTIKVILARYENGQLNPWYNLGDHPWQNSEVKVMSYIVSSEKEVDDEKLKILINDCKQKLPDKGKYSILLPLIKNDSGFWVGTALDQNGKDIKVIYDTNIGFRKATRGEIK